MPDRAASLRPAEGLFSRQLGFFARAALLGAFLTALLLVPVIGPFTVGLLLIPFSWIPGLEPFTHTSPLVTFGYVWVRVHTWTILPIFWAFYVVEVWLFLTLRDLLRSELPPDDPQTLLHATDDAIVAAIRQYQATGAATINCPKCHRGIVVEPVEGERTTVRLACACGACSGKFDHAAVQA